MKHVSKTMKFFSILIVITLAISSTVYGIYRAYSIGTRSLSFSLLLSNGNTVVQSEQPCAPKIIDGMIPIVWDAQVEKWKVTYQDDPNWYNYVDEDLDGNITVDEKRWANVMMPDTQIVSYIVGTYIDDVNLGSMFVWIPRYEYKITYYTDDTKLIVSQEKTVYASIDVKFVSSQNTTPTTGYSIHPAFRNGTSSDFFNGEWSSEIDGIWMAKFEAGGTLNQIKIVPNVSAIKQVAIKDAYTNSLTQTYGMTTNANLLNTHMAKNSEWGAAAILGYSIYGLDGVHPYVNNYMSNTFLTNTGYAGNTINADRVTTINQANLYNKTAGLRASTTNNIYGIYDMVGGRNEYTAAVHESGIDASNPFTTNTSTRYKTIYTGINGSQYPKFGDMQYEAYKVDGSSSGLSGTTTKYMSASNGSFIMRGGGPTNGPDGSSLFAYYISDGTANNYRGFRTVICIE